MSWKSLVTASLLCALASPAFATPTVTMTNAGLNAQGNWVWNVAIANTDGGGALPPTGSSPLGAELGFKETASTLLGSTNLSSGVGDDFDTSNPGKPIWGWEVIGVNANNFPDGLQSNCAVGCSSNVPGNNPNSVFAALGSINYNTLGPHDFIQIVTKGPTAASAGAPTATRKSSVQLLGAYAGAGRIAEAIVAAPGSANYDTYTGQQFRVATPGDTDLTAGVGLDDFNAVLSHIGLPAFWQQGNFHANDGSNVNLDDFNTVLGAIGLPSGTQGAGPGPGAGAGSGLGGGSVPEPTSLMLVALGSLAFVAKRRRK